MKDKWIIFIIAIGILLALFGVYHYADADIYGTSLLAEWTLDSNATINNIQDVRGGNTGDLVGNLSTSTQAGRIGQALFCDTNTEVFVPVINLSSLTQDTFSFWWKPGATYTSASGEKDILWINDNPAKTTEYVFVAVNGAGADGNIAIDHKLDAQGDQLSETTGITTWTANKWYFLTITSGSAGVKMYVNGLLNNTAAANTRSTNSMITPSVATLTFCDGRFNNSPGTGSISTMDDVRVYNRNLSAAEVQQLYYQGIGQHSQ